MSTISSNPSLGYRKTKELECRILCQPHHKKITIRTFNLDLYLAGYLDSKLSWKQMKCGCNTCHSIIPLDSIKLIRMTSRSHLSCSSLTELQAFSSQAKSRKGNVFTDKHTSQSQHD